MKNIVCTAVISSLAAAAVMYAVMQSAHAQGAATRRTVLENPRVEVIDRSIPPGGERVPYIRPSDQVIVFLNDAKYERIDAETGEKIVRTRKGGDVIWHDRGENAPKLVNVGSEPFRSLIIQLK